MERGGHILVAELGAEALLFRKASDNKYNRVGRKAIIEKYMDSGARIST
jgi:hypothetical protein